MIGLAASPDTDVLNGDDWDTGSARPSTLTPHSDPSRRPTVRAAAERAAKIVGLNNIRPTLPGLARRPRCGTGSVWGRGSGLGAVVPTRWPDPCGALQVAGGCRGVRSRSMLRRRWSMAWSGVSRRARTSSPAVWPSPMIAASSQVGGRVGSNSPVCWPRVMRRCSGASIGWWRSCSCAGLAGGVARWVMNGLSPHGLPADVEEPDERLGCGAGVEVGGADGVRDPLGDLVEQGVDECVTRPEVRIDRLSADPGRGGDVVHAGLGPIGQDPRCRVENGRGVALGVRASPSAGSPARSSLTRLTSLADPPNLDTVVKDAWLRRRVGRWVPQRENAVQARGLAKIFGRDPGRRRAST